MNERVTRAGKPDSTPISTVAPENEFPCTAVINGTVCRGENKQSSAS